MANTRFRSETGLYVTGDSNTEIQTVSYFKENVNVTKDLTANGITVANNITVSGVSDFQDAVSVIAADPAASASASIDINTSTEDTSYVFSDGTKAWTINLTSDPDPSTTVSVGDRISNSTFAYIVINVTNDQNFIAKNLNGQNANPNAVNDKTHYKRSDAIRLESTGTPGSYLSVDQYGVLISGDTDIATGTLIIQGDLRVEGDQIQIGELLYDGDIVATQSGLTLGGLNSGTTTFDADYHPWTLNSANIFVGANTSFTANTINQTGPGLFTTQAGNKIGTTSYRWDVNARDITANSSILPDTTGRALGNSGARWALNSSTIDSSSTVTLTSTTGTALSVAGNTAFDTDTLFIDVTNDRIGVNTVPGAYALDVAGEIHIANLHIDDTDIITNLNADKLDGQHGSSYLRSDTADIKDTGDLTFNDNIHLYLGSGSDLDIYHSGSDSYIEEQGTGNLYIQSTGGAIVVRTNTTENAIECVENGAVTLYYDASAKLSTSAAGVSVTGAMDVTGNITASRFISDVAQGTAPFSVTSTTKVTNLNADLLDDISSDSFLRSDVAATKTSGDLTLNDNIDLNIGSGNDLKIYHTGTDSYISHQNNVAGNDLVIRSIQDVVIQSGNGTTGYESAIEAINNGAVTLFHSGSSKLVTASDGIDVTGDVGATTFTGSGANLTNLNGSQISNGEIPSARLPSVNIGTTSVPLSRASGALTLNDVYLGTGSQVYASANATSSAFRIPFLLSTVDTSGSADLGRDSAGGFTYNPSTNTLAVNTIDATTGTFDTLTTSALTASSTTKVTNLNADLLDGIDSSSFLRSNADDVFSGGTYIRWDDNKEIRFGTGSDFIFDFNGTNLIIHENVGGNILITNTTDVTTVTIDPTAGDISVAGNLVPDTDNTGFVGNSAFTWNNGQFTDLSIDNVISVRGAVDLADNDEIRLGTSDNFLIDFNGTNLIINENVGGNILITNTSDATTVTIDPTAGSINATGSITGSSFSGSIDAGNISSGTLPVSRGGTGATTFTNGGILLGSGTSAITALGVAANGQIPIGDGTTDPVLATITGGTNITVTNGAGSITIAHNGAASTLDGIDSSDFMRLRDSHATSTVPYGWDGSGNKGIVFGYIGSTNIDHIHFNDATNDFHFVGDSTYGATGNANLIANNFYARNQLYIWEGSHYLGFDVAADLTANRTLTFDVNNADRTLTISGNATISGTNTGDQTITLTGDVTGTGTGTFATTITAGAVGTTELAAGAVGTTELATGAVTSAKMDTTTNGYGTRHIVTAAPTSGGATGDIWYVY